MSYHKYTKEHDIAYNRAFNELNDACHAMRCLLVTLKRFNIIEHVTPIYKPLKQKYFYAHMNGALLGVHAGYCPNRKSLT